MTEVAWMVTYSDGSTDVTTDRDQAGYWRDLLTCPVQGLMLVPSESPSDGAIYQAVSHASMTAFERQELEEALDMALSRASK